MAFPGRLIYGKIVLPGRSILMRLHKNVNRPSGKDNLEVLPEGQFSWNSLLGSPNTFVANPSAYRVGHTGKGEKLNYSQLSSSQSRFLAVAQFPSPSGVESCGPTLYMVGIISAISPFYM